MPTHKWWLRFSSACRPCARARSSPAILFALCSATSCVSLFASFDDDECQAEKCPGACKSHVRTTQGLPLGHWQAERPLAQRLISGGKKQAFYPGDRNCKKKRFRSSCVLLARSGLLRFACCVAKRKKRSACGPYLFASLNSLAATDSYDRPQCLPEGPSKVAPSLGVREICSSFCFEHETGTNELCDR